MPRRSVSGQLLAEVDRLAEHVEDPPQRDGADRHGDGAAGVGHLGAAGRPSVGVHRDRAHAIVAEVLLDLADEQRVGGAGDARLFMAQPGQVALITLACSVLR